VFSLALIQAHRTRHEEDFNLITRIAQRDEEALAELYDHYAPLVYALSLRIVKTAGDAKDIMQEVFLYVWDGAATLADAKGNVYIWIVDITRRKAIARLLSTQQMGNGIFEEDVTGGFADEPYLSNSQLTSISSESEDMIMNALLAVTDEQRAILELSYYEGYTQQEIAERLDIPLGTVKTRMRMGLMTLREYLKERLTEDGQGRIHRTE
jgi:RNA polymerase sigma-70 factor, ECF subfamily